jgi:hypothetical protein
MINWKGFGRKRSLPNVMVLSHHSPGGTKGNHEDPSIKSAGRRGGHFYPGTYRIRSRIDELWFLPKTVRYVTIIVYLAAVRFFGIISDK